MKSACPAEGGNEGNRKKGGFVQQTRRMKGEWRKCEGKKKTTAGQKRTKRGSRGYSEQREKKKSQRNPTKGGRKKGQEKNQKRKHERMSMVGTVVSKEWNPSEKKKPQRLNKKKRKKSWDN